MSKEMVESWSNGSNLDYLVRNVLRDGHRVESRYGDCLERIGGRLRCESGSLFTRKGINWALGWMEMYQLIAGVYFPEGLKKVAPNADHSLFTYDMAYGPRVRDQIPVIIEALRRDPLTRQAVVFVGKPENGPTSSLPCTVSIQFLIRDQQIHAVVNMRSWDLCRGLPYDLMMFSGLLEVLGRCLNVPTGNVTVCAGSTHIYTGLVDMVPKLSKLKWSFDESVPDTWGECVQWFEAGMYTLKKGEQPQGIIYTER